MVRVSTGLARGIVLAAVLFAGSRLSDPTPSRLDHSLKLIHSQDFAPILDVTRRRIEGHFTPERQEQFHRELFSASGKWKALTRGREAYERYVGRAFERTVLEPGTLARVFQAIRQDWDFGTRAAENRLLSELYEDLRYSRPDLTPVQLRVEYGRLSESLAPCVIRDLGMNLVSIGGSEASAMIVTAALTSAGLLGGTAAAGGASGICTFGVGLVVGLVVGIVIDETAGEAYEEVARVKIRLKIEEIRNRLIDDLFAALAAAIRTYVTLQERCVRALYEGGHHELVAARR